MNWTHKLLMTLMLLFSYHYSYPTNNKVLSVSKGKINIVVRYQEARKNDTLYLIVSSNYINKPLGETFTYSATQNGDGVYKFSFPAQTVHGFFELLALRTFTNKTGRLDRMPLLHPQFWETGDSIDIRLSHQETSVGIHSTCVFSGKGAEKYQARYNLLNKLDGEDLYFDGNILNSSQHLTLSEKTKYNLIQLRNYKGRTSDISYNILKADIYFKDRSSIFIFINNFYQKLVSGYNQTTLMEFQSKFIKDFKVDNIEEEISLEGLVNSGQYLNYAFRKVQALSKIESLELSKISEIDSIVKYYEGDIRDFLLVLFFKNNRRLINRESQINIVMDIVENQLCKKLLKEELSNTMKKKFGDYSFIDLNADVVKLSDFNNKIVIIDFWFTGCAYCSLYYKEVLSKIETKYNSDNRVVFLSINIDSSIAKWKNSVLSKKYTSLNVVNLNVGQNGNRHPIIVDYKIEEFPSVILLTKGGILHQLNSETLYKFETLSREINSLF